jgi:hypothetical protein
MNFDPGLAGVPMVADTLAAVSDPHSRENGNFTRPRRDNEAMVTV